MRRKALLGAAALVLLVAALAGGRVLLKKLAFFSVRRIELVGARYLTPEEVTRALRLPARASIFDATEPLTRRANTIPGVRRAHHRRRAGTDRQGTLTGRAVPSVQRLP